MEQFKKESSLKILSQNRSADCSSVCLFDVGQNDFEIYLRERFSRKKRDSDTFFETIQMLDKQINLNDYKLTETSYLRCPADDEKNQIQFFPIDAYIEKRNLQRFSSGYNKEIRFVSHHRAHAYAASSLAPFDEAIVIVFDGAGSDFRDPFDHMDERRFLPESHPVSNYIHCAERVSVYIKQLGKLECVSKDWQYFIEYQKPFAKVFNPSLGIIFEAASELIFGNRNEAGKVMGLAPFGQTSEHGGVGHFLENLDWQKRFTGQSKLEWQRDSNFSYFKDLAATVQNIFEDEFKSLLKNVRQQFPSIENLVLTGGCALNCVANNLALQNSIFKEVYVPPFPGDEGVAYGAAVSFAYDSDRDVDLNNLRHRAHGYWGPKRDAVDLKTLEVLFPSARITPLERESLPTKIATLLKEQNLVGLFIGRSECGPRALGHRSIVADPRMKDLKDYLNDSIKNRESFRPYGGSTILEKVQDIFEVPANFRSPYMSFAPHVKEKFQKDLQSIIHIDGTSRIQTVTENQCPIFYQIIKSFGDLTGIYCLLNTSLNVMGEPIVESLEDLKRFFDNSEVANLLVDTFLIEKTIE